MVLSTQKDNYCPAQRCTEEITQASGKTAANPTAASLTGIALSTAVSLLPLLPVTAQAANPEGGPLPLATSNLPVTATPPDGIELGGASELEQDESSLKELESDLSSSDKSDLGGVALDKVVMAEKVLEAPQESLNSEVGVIAQRPLVPTPAETPLQQQVQSILINDIYTLGTGDVLSVNIFTAPELTEDQTFTVLVDGTINLPWIGKVPVVGRTLDETSRILSTAYAPLINDPLVSVNLISPRQLKVGVVGEVNRPGAYVINPSAGENPLTGRDAASTWPTVIDAIEAANGITRIADVRQIEVRRPDQSGIEKVFEIDLWDLLQTGDLNQDITLRDGDTVIVPEAIAQTPEELAELAIASFSPDTIAVNVVGEAVAPGEVVLRPNSSLNQAILTAGGFDKARARRKKVDLIRLNPDGSVTKRRIRVDLAAGVNEETNPALQNGDVVIINRSTIARTGDILETILRPFDALLGITDSVTGIRDTGDDN